MAKDYAIKFYGSKSWQDARSRYIADRRRIDGGMCERCKERLGYIVHHKTRLNPNTVNNADIALGLANFEYVCKDCHDREHYGEIHRREVPSAVCCEFDDDGEPIDLRKF